MKLLTITALLLASSISFGQTGTLIGIYDGNDNPNSNSGILEDMETDIFDFTGETIDLELYGKSDDGDNSFTSSSSASKDGTWSSDDSVEFITVKGGNQFSLWWYEGGATSGEWTTAGLRNDGGKQPGVSHLSAWNDSSTPGDAPFEGGLLSFLMVGLVSLLRKRK